MSSLHNNTQPAQRNSKNIPLFLLVLPIFSILHACNDMPGFIPFKLIAIFLLISYTLMAIIWYISWKITKEATISAIITFTILLFTLFFGAYHDFIKKMVGNTVVSSYKVIIPLTIIATFLFLRYLIKRENASRKVSSYLTVVMTILVMLEVFMFFIHNISISKTNNLIYTDTTITGQYKPCNQRDSLKPDIYFLVFDEYTNNKTLKEVWNFNNDNITNWLAGQQFYIVTDGEANYDFTPLSLSSTFNMNYLDNWKENDKDSVFYILQAVKSISNNTTLSLLKKEDYTIRFFAPFKNTIENIGLLQEFADYPQKKVYNHTFPGRVQRDILWNFIPASPTTVKTEEGQFTILNWEKRVEDVQLTIQKIKSSTNTQATRKPQFVYGHFMVTHHPHLFNADGTTRTAADVSLKKNLSDTYTEQILYANKIIQELVTHIQRTNRKNTIIVIEGDHGFRHGQYKHNFSNFNALYFPDQRYQQLYTTMSPVNTFRVIFNHYFCQTLDLLKDSTIKAKN